MANYEGRSHYTHEVNQEYKDGWNAIFGKKNNPGAVDVNEIHTTGRKEKSPEKSGTKDSA